MANHHQPSNTRQTKGEERTSSTTLSSTRKRRSSNSHLSLSPALKEGRGKEQGSAYASGPPTGKKTKFDSDNLNSTGEGFAGGGREGRNSPAREKEVAPHFSGGETGERREKREKARVVSKDPLSLRRPGEGGAFGVDEVFEEGFSWRVDKDDQGPTSSTSPAPDSADTSSIPDSLPPAHPQPLPSTSTATVPLAPKSKRTSNLSQSQRARAKNVRDAWSRNEGLTAKESNSRWVDILAASKWDGEMAIAVAKQYRGGKKEDERRERAKEGLRSVVYEQVETRVPGLTAQPTREVQEAVENGRNGLVSSEANGRPTTPVSTGPFFNPFSSKEPLPRSSNLNLLSPPTSEVKSRSSALTAPVRIEEDLPTTDRALVRTAIQLVQRLLTDVASETVLDLVELMQEDVQTAEIFLALESDELKEMWVQRRIGKMSTGGRV